MRDPHREEPAPPHTATSRRDFLRTALRGGACLSLGAVACSRSSKKKETAGTSTGKRARYYVGLLMSGGHDTVYTTDPKERGEVDAGVYLPADNAITAVGNLRLGRHFAPLEPMARDLTLLNGIQLGTANHETGLMQFFRLKTNTVVSMPSLLDIVGAHRDSQPLGSIYLNVLFRNLHTPKFIGTADRFYHGERNLLDEVAATNPDQLRQLGKVLAAKAQSLRREGQRTSTSVTLSNLSDAARFFERVADVEPLVKKTYSDNYMPQTMAESFDQAAWLLENDLACAVGIDLGLLEWDSHIANHSRQTLANTTFVKHFTRFMKRLRESDNAHGNVAENTVIFAGSDMGRFPRLNDMQGKDHLPQTSFFFAGPGWRGGRSFGQTGKQMDAMPISLKTGRPGQSGGKKLILDDIGATVLTLAGLDPELYGYHGNVLDFLLQERMS